MSKEEIKTTSTGLRVPRPVFTGDLVAGLVNAIVSIPGGIANGVLAGVNPVYGLYSMIIGTPIAALFTSSVIMNVDSTSATSLATLDALVGVPKSEQLTYLVVLSFLVGLFMFIFGILKLGFVARFVSNAVMTGFLSGLGILTILSQLADLTGYVSSANQKVFQAIDTLFQWQQFNWPTLLVGLLTIALIVGINQTKYERYSFAVGVILTTLLVFLSGLDSVAMVGDTTAIPRSLPALNLPTLSLIPPMILPALTIAIIALVQAVGVSQGIPNPDGDYPDPSGDFRGQGVANMAVGLVGGLPVGGSVSGTIQLQSIGGKSRWANIFTGILTAVCVMLIIPFIESIPMTTLAGTLIVVGVQMINKEGIERVWRTGRVPTAVMLITFIITLFAPLQIAVSVGVLFSGIMFIYQSADEVRIERVVPLPDGSYIEEAVPDTLSSGEIVILLPVGSLFFAGAAYFESQLPEIGVARHAVVIIILRDRDKIGSTFVRVIERYAQKLDATGNKLILTGVSEGVMEQLKDTELMALLGDEDIIPADPRFFEPLKRALADAQAWIATQNDDSYAKL
ncbi:MAG: SulP family inorganic anion transporter [Ardenticatenaceae bacterium]|nr:SulP family inorganic anion transporter [Ardenticatenaceae bacterium]